MRWNDSTGFYRPQYQTRSELFVRTNLLDRFPVGNLGHQWRRSFTSTDRECASRRRGGTRLVVGGYRTLSTLLEIRILSATVSWQFRNFLGERYTQVPGFVHAAADELLRRSLVRSSIDKSHCRSVG